MNIQRNKNNDLIYFPNLDGLRFFSFIAVFIAHSFATDNSVIINSEWYQLIKGRLFSDGDLGVSFFFVLSGFLITYLLLQEIERTGTINIISFYIRRALRIWPLYYFCVLFGFTFFPLLKSMFGQSPNETADPVLCSLFLNNFNAIINGPPDSSVLSVLWSVAIEEQFYLIWPLLFYFVPSRNYKFIFFAIIGISLWYRSMYIGGPINLHTLGVVSDMALGGLGAYYSLRSNYLNKFFETSKRALHLVPYAVVIVLLFFKNDIFKYDLLIIFQKIITGLFFLWIILEQNFNQNSYFKISSMKRISVLGKYTYGLYCYHQIAILITVTLLKSLHLYNDSFQLLLIAFPFSLLLSIVMAYLSFHLVEEKILKLKGKFAIVKTQ